MTESAQDNRRPSSAKDASSDGGGNASACPEPDLRPPRIVRRHRGGDLFDTVASRAVTLDRVVDLVLLGEPVCVFDEVSREDLTIAVIAPRLLARLRRSDARSGDAASAITRAAAELSEARAQIARLHGHVAEVEALLQTAVDAGGARANAPRREGE